MCEPTTAMLAISTAVSMAGTGASLIQQNQTANAQQKALNETTRENRSQINDQAQQRIMERARAAQAERARITTLAGESGVAGNSVDAQLRDTRFQQGYDSATINQNRMNQLRGSQTQARAEASRIAQPDYIGAGLQIAESGFNYYDASKRR